MGGGWREQVERIKRRDRKEKLMWLVDAYHVSKEEWKERTWEVGTQGRESMLICYLPIAEDRPESLSLFLSPFPLGMATGAQGGAGG
jgi:hypothetical protein